MQRYVECLITDNFIFYRNYNLISYSVFNFLLHKHIYLLLPFILPFKSVGINYAIKLVFFKSESAFICKY
jgi:hypothetical protein